MPLIQTDSQHYSDIADAIRDMSGNEETFYPSEMAAGVRSIPQTIAIQPIIYSLEEREVGVWTDGKPLYEKTKIYNLSDLYQSSYGYYREIADSNDQEIHNVVGYAYASAGFLCCLGSRCYRYGSNQNVYWEYHNLSKNVYLRFFQDAPSEYGTITIVFTYQYTKTTDTPGSGTWTPSGVPAHHYSTEEQVIGTWIDGKPLYEKSFETESFSIQDGSRYVVVYSSYGISSIKNMINFKCILLNATTNAFLALLPYDTLNGSNRFSILFAADTTQAYITRIGQAISNIKAIVTIQYTKTTD